jgi:putative holliday junction resolvase
MRLKTVIGFDFGTRHIGVAVGQTISMTTQSCMSIPACQGVPCWKKMEKLLKT